MEAIASRPIGGCQLLDGLWSQLRVGAAIKKAGDGRRFTTNMERVLFALVANRGIEPMSKMSAAEWVCQDVHIPGLPAMDDDQAYRAMGPAGGGRYRGGRCRKACFLRRGPADRSGWAVAGGGHATAGLTEDSPMANRYQPWQP
jgi:hypothetical protein